MNVLIPSIPQASSFAGDIDNLIILIAVLVGFWFLVAEAMFLGLLFKFRKKDGVKSQYITGDEKHLKKWINIPHILILLCDILIVYGAINVWVDVKQDMPEATKTVRITGQQWAWAFQHPGADGQLDTDDDISTVDTLHVAVDEVYHFELQSKDVIHSFSVPVFRLKQDMIPGRTIKGWFEPTLEGTFDIQCAEMCGIGHGIMAGSIVVASAEDHAAWVAVNTTTAVAAATVSE